MKKNEMTNAEVYWNTGFEFLEEYLPKIRKLSPHTIEAYRDSLNMYFTYLEDELNIPRSKVSFSNLEKETVQAFQAWLLNTKGCSAKTTNLRLSAITSFLEFSCNKYPILTKLYVAAKGIHRTKIQKQQIEYFEQEQMKAILGAQDPKSRIGRRNMVILILLYDTAARVSELIGLNISNLHLTSNPPYVTIHGKGDKYRNVPLMSGTVKHLNRYLKEFHPNLEGTSPLFYATLDAKKHALSTDSVELILKKAADIAKEKGVKMPDKVHCHMVRKTRAMDLYQRGVPLEHIQQLLGHENASTTSGFYAFATIDTLSKSMAKAGCTSGENEDKLWKDAKSISRLRRF